MQAVSVPKFETRSTQHFVQLLLACGNVRGETGSEIVAVTSLAADSDEVS